MAARYGGLLQRGAMESEVLHPREYVVRQQLHAAHAPGHDLEPDAVQRPGRQQHGLLQLQQHPFDGPRGAWGRRAARRVCAGVSCVSRKTPRVRPARSAPPDAATNSSGIRTADTSKTYCPHCRSKHSYPTPAFSIPVPDFPQYQCGKPKGPLREGVNGKADRERVAADLQLLTPPAASFPSCRKR